MEEVAAAHVSAMERGRPGECYLLGGENLTMKALVDLVAATAGGKAPSMRMPVGVAAVLGSGYEMHVAADRQAAVDHGRLVEAGGAALCLGLRQGGA